jgi:hypothetical protein
MITDSAIDKMSIPEIRDVVAEFKHHIFHLERSQNELAAALDEDPEDRDFAFAYFENKETIALKHESIAKLEAKLKDVDVAYCREEVASERQQLREQSIRAQTRVTISTNINDIHATSIQDVGTSQLVDATEEQGVDNNLTGPEEVVATQGIFI